jgi:hypothetical protein
VNGLGPRVEPGPDDRGGIQVGNDGRRFADPHGVIGLSNVPGPRIGIRMDGDRTHAQPAHGPEDPAGHLATVGDEDPLEGR